MNEERIKEIFREQLSGLKPTLFDWEIKGIKAVAAEARTEGIDEMRDISSKEVPSKVLNMPGKSLRVINVCRIIRETIEQIAARLKGER